MSLPTREEYEFRAQVRNETIDELCTWARSCIEQIDHGSEAYRACAAMINVIESKKTGRQPDTANLGTTVESDGQVVTHYPLSHKP